MQFKVWAAQYSLPTFRCSEFEVPQVIPLPKTRSPRVRVPYRSRAVKDPRGMLTDFGMSLPADTEIRVWDSTWDEDRLAGLVTRDSMIGTGMPRRPEEVGM